MRKNEHNKTILILFLCLSFLFSAILISYNLQDQKLNYEENENFINPKVAADPIPLPIGRIFLNVTPAIIYRLSESINITINTIDFSEANYTQIQITFTNGSVSNFNMISGGSDSFYYVYTPKYNAPIGLHNVSFLIYSITGILQNTQATYKEFTVITNYVANLNSAEYYIGDTLYAELSIDNYAPHMFVWSITIVDGVNELTQTNLLNLEDNAVQITLTLSNEIFPQVEKTYFIKVNMTGSGETWAAYFPFMVKNFDPVITSVILTPNEVYRTEEYEISVNVTDIETASEDLLVSMYLQDSEGEDLPGESLEYVSGNLFSGTFSVPGDSPVGQYRINVIARDVNGATDSEIAFLPVKNNLPEIHSYEINSESMDQSISVPYGRNLVFSFNVSDDDRVAHIKIALLDENNEWYNVTKIYDGIDTEIVIRTVELITGTWYVYIYAIDSDGEISDYNSDFSLAPQGIRIIPEVLSDYIPWIVLIVGFGIGVLVGVGIIYTYFKSKSSEPQGVKPKKKELPHKKLLKKEKIKIEPIKEELDKEDIAELEPKKEEKKERVVNRKIKRKI